jgi:hypothetical protein
MSVATTLAEGLFTSLLQPSQHPRPGIARHAAFVELKARTVKGCACDVAVEFGEHPDTAAARMVWALALVAATYPRRGSR